MDNRPGATLYARVIWIIRHCSKNYPKGMNNQEILNELCAAGDTASTLEEVKMVVDSLGKAN